MASMEDLELLRAVIAVALADGEIGNSEMGVIRGLVERTGVGQISFEAMLKAAKENPSFAANILIFAPEKARRALEILVAGAGLDGNVSTQEREVIERIAKQFKISGAELNEVFNAGVRRANALRKGHGS